MVLAAAAAAATAAAAVVIQKFMTLRLLIKLQTFNYALRTDRPAPTFSLASTPEEDFAS
jgi:hypothetical protein